MAMNNFFNFFFKRKQKAVYLDVRESYHGGLETFINKDVYSFETPYKKQLISFLQGVIQDLGGNEDGHIKSKRH